MRERVRERGGVGGCGGDGVGARAGDGVGVHEQHEQHGKPHFYQRKRGTTKSRSPLVASA